MIFFIGQLPSEFYGVLGRKDLVSFWPLIARSAVLIVAMSLVLLSLIF